MAKERSPAIQEIEEDHRHIRELFDRLDRRFSEVEKGTADLYALLDEACAQVQSHFDHEEQGGYFRDVVARAPNLLHRVEELKAQHADLLAAGQEVVGRAKSQGPSGDFWTRTRSELEAFIKQFFEHEGAENQLVQEAYSRDMGAAD